MRVYESCSFALSTCAWSTFTVPSSWRTSDGLLVDLLRGDRVLREQRAVALEVEARVVELRGVARELPLDLRRAPPGTATGSICATSIALPSRSVPR